MIMEFAENREKNDDYEIVSESVTIEKSEEEKEEEKEMFTVLDERLVPLAYTLDEVKRLNNVTDGNLRLGKVDDTNIAVIGVPEDVEPFERVKLADAYQNDDAFIPLNEEDCKRECFLVYPYNNNYSRELDYTIQMIIKDRKIQNEIPRIQFQSTETVEPEANREHSAPTLMKSIGRMRF